MSATLVAGTGLVLFSKPLILDAEAPSDAESLIPSHRKPIYDDVTASAVDILPSQERSRPEFTSPTDKLATQVSHLRLTIHSYATSIESQADGLLSRAFSAEKSLADTVSSLAPSRESGEKVLPGALYVLVAAMSGSVLTRNRNFLLRTITPIVLGVGTANVVVPVTTHNVGQLVWRWEQRWPALAQAHADSQARVEKFVATGWEHAKLSKDILEGKIGEAREGLEGWVKKGR